MHTMKTGSALLVGLVVSFLAAGCGEEVPTQLGEARPLFQEVDAEVTGRVGDPVAPASVVSSHGSHLGPGSIDITPASPTFVSNCIPFGNNTSFGFTG